MSLQPLIVVSGVLHFGTLLASAAVPRVLDWRCASKLDRSRGNWSGCTGCLSCW